MPDPTYNLDEINANPVWKLAFLLSEVDNDNAPIGWSRYVPMGEAVVRTYDMLEKGGPDA